MRLQVTFIDVKKPPFDHVNRDCLRYKLLMSGIIGQIFKILKIFIIVIQLLNSRIMQEYLAILNEIWVYAKGRAYRLSCLTSS